LQGGVGDFTRELARALVALDHQVTVVTSSKASSAPIASSTAEPLLCSTVSRWTWTSWAQIMQAMSDSHSDILHIQYQTAAYAMHPAINLLPWRLRMTRERPQVVVTYHDLRVPYLFPKAGRVREWVTWIMARWSDAAVATNVEDYQQLLERAHTRARRAAHRPILRLIPIGSNIHPQLPEGFSRLAWRSRLGVAEDETLLCYFGFLNESKGANTLFRALEESARRGHRVKLLMIGGQVGDSDPTNLKYLEHVKALSTQLGLAGDVLWTGYTAPDQVSASFRAADICVLPYRDGASYRRGSFMAALAHGLPIVSTKPRVPIDGLHDGDNILLVPADDHLATADAVEKLIKAPALRTHLSDGATELANEFTWDHIAARTVALYAELLS